MWIKSKLWRRVGNTGGAACLIAALLLLSPGVSVVRAEDGIGYRQGALEERLGGSEVALGFQQEGEVVDALCCIWMIRAERLLPDCEGTHE